jgi:hypothetical protein
MNKTASAIEIDELFLMVNVRGRSSGLPLNIWIGPRGHARHAARIKAQMNHRAQFGLDQLAVVSVEDDPPRYGFVVCIVAGGRRDRAPGLSRRHAGG